VSDREALDEEGFRAGWAPSATTAKTPRLLRPLPRRHSISAPRPHQLQGDPHRQIHLPDGTRPTGRGALIEALLDEQEGFDILMVKPGPGLPRHHPSDAPGKTELPIAAYQRQRRIRDGLRRRHERGLRSNERAIVARNPCSASKRGWWPTSSSLPRRDAAAWLPRRLRACFPAGEGSPATEWRHFKQKPMAVQRLAHVPCGVEDMPRPRAFYQALGSSVTWEAGQLTYLQSPKRRMAFALLAKDHTAAGPISPFILRPR